MSLAAKVKGHYITTAWLSHSRMDSGPFAAKESECRPLVVFFFFFFFLLFSSFCQAPVRLVDIAAMASWGSSGLAT